MLDDFKFQLNKIDNIFFRMTDNMEEFLLEYIQLSRLIPTIFSTSSSSELKIQFNNRVNKNIEEDINQCISHLCDWLLERSNRTVHQLNKRLHSNSTNARRSEQFVRSTADKSDADFSVSRQQILNQLQSQCQNVRDRLEKFFAISIFLFERFYTNKKQQQEHMRMTFLHRFVRRCWAQLLSKSVLLDSVRCLINVSKLLYSHLGALAALASFDWTGLLGASLIGILGLYFIPMRRSAIKQEMKDRIDKTRLDLTEQLRKHFSHEVDITERKMRELIMPYRYIQHYFLA